MAFKKRKQRQRRGWASHCSQKKLHTHNCLQIPHLTSPILDIILSNFGRHSEGNKRPSQEISACPADTSHPQWATQALAQPPLTHPPTHPRSQTCTHAPTKPPPLTHPLIHSPIHAQISTPEDIGPRSTAICTHVSHRASAQTLMDKTPFISKRVTSKIARRLDENQKQMNQHGCGQHGVHAHLCCPPTGRVWKSRIISASEYRNC